MLTAARPGTALSSVSAVVAAYESDAMTPARIAATNGDALCLGLLVIAGASTATDGVAPPPPVADEGDEGASETAGAGAGGSSKGKKGGKAKAAKKGGKAKAAAKKGNDGAEERELELAPALAEAAVAAAAAATRAVCRARMSLVLQRNFFTMKCESERIQTRAVFGVAFAGDDFYARSA